MHYLPVLFGLTRLVLGVLIALQVFKIKNGKIPASNGILSRYPNWFTVLSGVLIVSGFYTLIWGRAEDYAIGKSAEWTAQDKETLIKNCLRDAAETRAELIPATQNYCACSVEGITTHISKKEYTANLSKPQEEQIRLQFPYFRKCLLELNAARERLRKAQ